MNRYALNWRRPWLVTVMLFALLAAACGDSGGTDSGGSAPNASEESESPVELEPLKLGYPGLSSAFLHTVIAEQAGIFAENGFDVEVITVQAPQIAAALEAGDIDVAPGLGSNIRGALSDVAVKVVAVTFGTFDYVIMANSARVSDVEELSGSKIATLAPTTSPGVALLTALENLRIDTNEVELLTVSDAPARERTLAAGDVDAALINTDAALRLGETDANMKIIYEPSELVPNPFTGVAVSDRMLDEDPEKVERLVRVFMEASRFILDEEDETIRIIGDSYNLNEEQAQDMYDLLRPIVVEDGLLTDDMLAGEARLDSLALGREVTTQELERAFDLSIVEQLQ